jgi:hypothetical protein
VQCDIVHQPPSKHHHVLQATDEFSIFRNSA